MATTSPQLPGRRSLLVRLFLSPEERRLRAGWRILAHFVLIVLCLILFELLALLLFATRRGMSSMLRDQATFFLAITVSTILARRFFDRRSFVSLGLWLNRWTIKDLLVGIGVSGGVMGVVYLLESAAGWLSFDGFSWKTQGSSAVMAGAAASFLAFVLVGWQEELLSRGYWLQNLEEGINLPWAVALSSLFFALGHLGNPHVSWAAVLGLLAAGLFLAYGYVRTRSLWLPVGLHIGWNFFEGTVFGFPVSGLEDFPRLVNQQVHGPALVTGGPFGPEAGLVIIPALLAGAVLVFFYTKGRKREASA